MSKETNEVIEEIKEHAVSEPVPLKEKLAYAFAQMPGTFYGGVMGVIQSFYYGWMGLQNFWIIIAQICYAAWNLTNDPLFGHAINNTRVYNKRRGEYQRYIPYIKYGAPLFSLAFALVFFPPAGWRGSSDLTVQVWLFVWYLVSQLAYDTMFTLVLCAHVALLPQMTLEQKEREQIQVLCSLFSLPAILLGFLLPVMFLADPTATSVRNFQILVIGVAIFGVVPYMILSYVVHEHSEHIPEEKTPLLEAIKLAFKNKSYIIYVIYDGISVFLLNLLIATLPFYLTWVLNPMMESSTEMILFWIGPVICLMFSIYIELKLAEKFSTKAALSYYLGVTALGMLFTFFVSFTRNWILVSIGFSIFMLAFSGDFIHHNPMRADTIDYDFWKISGERREGLYAGIGPLLSKPMISVALATPTTLMTIFGLVNVGGKLQATEGMANATLSLNIAMALIPGLVALLGFIIWVKFYPLTGDLVEEMKDDLRTIHEEKRRKYLEELKKSKNAEESETRD
ncbi:MAG: MFS transporter [Promethearchaeia archaeon]